jgi:endonuclease/exonuclease/phosphatase family metal-dependent hydrolase
MNRGIAVLSIASLLAAACTDAGSPRLDPVAPGLSKGALPHNPGRGADRSEAIVAMTRNLYLGTDVFAVAAAGSDVQALAMAVGAGWQEVVASDPAARMDAIAGEIAEEMPQVVGLQEVASFALSDAATHEAVAGYDFLALLLQALEARGAHYRVAVSNPNVMVTLPALLPGVGLRLLSLLDREVILVRSDVKVLSTRQGSYAAHLNFPVGETVLPVPRGWALAEVSFGGRDFTFVDTHLEVERFPEIQQAQAQQFAAILAQVPGVVILAGDLNSDAYDGAFASRPIDTESYEILQAAGFVDLWTEYAPGDLGLTCCHDEDLRDDVPSFEMRIDLLLVRSPFRPASGKLPGAVHAAVLGEEPADRTDSGLWPSDHAGLIASLRLPQRAFSTTE